MITRTVPAQVLIVALRSVADGAVFSPIPRFSRSSWGILFSVREF